MKTLSVSFGFLLASFLIVFAVAAHASDDGGCEKYNSRIKAVTGAKPSFREENFRVFSRLLEDYPGAGCSPSSYFTLVREMTENAEKWDLGYDQRLELGRMIARNSRRVLAEPANLVSALVQAAIYREAADAGFISLSPEQRLELERVRKEAELLRTKLLARYRTSDSAEAIREDERRETRPIQERLLSLI